MTWSLSSCIIVISMIVGSLLVISSQFGKSSSISSEVFECGIDPLIKGRMPTCIHFFHIGILFLVFDVELAVFLPVITAGMSEEFWVVFWTMYVVILVLGLLLETMLGGLSWKE